MKDELSDKELESVVAGKGLVKTLLPLLPPITIGPFPANSVRGGCAGGVCKPR